MSFDAEHASATEEPMPLRTRRNGWSSSPPPPPSRRSRAALVAFGVIWVTIGVASTAYLIERRDGRASMSMGVNTEQAPQDR